MRIAFVYDRVVKFGGAERILVALHELWPEAPLYTAVYRAETAPWSKTFTIKDSFLRQWPLSVIPHELLPVLTPIAFESFDFDDYDIVLSITSADAKAVITKPHTLHVCYCLTPTRYLWSGYDEYLREPGFSMINPLVRTGLRLLAPKLRSYDRIVANRPDRYIAISETVARRIRTYYGKPSTVIYPPVDTPAPVHNGGNNGYYLIVSRLVPYKKIDYAIRACTARGWNLKIIGKGIDEKRLKKLAGPTVEFLGGNLTDEEVGWYHQSCKALIFPGEEDFGITAVEAQSYGKPVVAYGRGGATETVVEEETGEFYSQPDARNLIRALEKLMSGNYDPEACRRSAMRFSKLQFQNSIRTTLVQLWKQWCKERYL